MKINVGNVDRVIRLVLGLAIIAVGVVFQSWWGALGIVPLATALVRRCPAYVPFGLSSCQIETGNDEG